MKNKKANGGGKLRYLCCFIELMRLRFVSREHLAKKNKGGNSVSAYYLYFTSECLLGEEQILSFFSCISSSVPLVLPLRICTHNMMPLFELSGAGLFLDNC